MFALTFTDDYGSNYSLTNPKLPNSITFQHGVEVVSVDSFGRGQLEHAVVNFTFTHTDDHIKEVMVPTKLFDINRQPLDFGAQTKFVVTSQYELTSCQISLQTAKFQSPKSNRTDVNLLVESLSRSIFSQGQRQLTGPQVQAVVKTYQGPTHRL